MIKKLTVSLFALCMSIATANAANIQISYEDGPNEGFNASSFAAPVGGNSGVTLGQQRKRAIEAAARWWEVRLQSNVTIKLNAAMNPLACNIFSGVLGAAGPEYLFVVNNKWHVSALADRIANQDIQGRDDIFAQFNSSIGSSGCLTSYSWYYGLDGNPGSQQFDFFSTLLHEMAHGLGMISLVAANGSQFNGKDDIFSSFLFDTTTNKSWTNMNDGERFNSARNNGNLVWKSNRIKSIASCRIIQGLNQGYPRMFAPSPYQSGSSVSHWDTAISPDELMEPYDTPTYSSDLTFTALQDMGWGVTSSVSPCPTGSNGKGSIIPVLQLLLE